MRRWPLGRQCARSAYPLRSLGAVAYESLMSRLWINQESLTTKAPRAQSCTKKTKSVRSLLVTLGVLGVLVVKDFFPFLPLHVASSDHSRLCHRRSSRTRFRERLRCPHGRDRRGQIHPD